MSAHSSEKPRNAATHAAQAISNTAPIVHLQFMTMMTMMTMRAHKAIAIIRIRRFHKAAARGFQRHNDSARATKTPITSAQVKKAASGQFISGVPCSRDTRPPARRVAQASWLSAMPAFNADNAAWLGRIGSLLN
jgi:hypothetical protein